MEERSDARSEELDLSAEGILRELLRDEEGEPEEEGTGERPDDENASLEIDPEPGAADDPERGDTDTGSPEPQASDAVPMDGAESDEEVVPRFPGGCSRIPIADLKALKRSLRHTAPDEEGMERLKESLRRLGQIEPIVITKEKVLVLGYRRVVEACELGWKEIAYVYLPEGAEPCAAEIAAADTREPIHILDLVRRVGDLLKMARSFSKIGELFGRSASYARYLLAIDCLHWRKKDQIRDGKLSPAAALAGEEASPEVKKIVREQLRAERKLYRASMPDEKGRPIWSPDLPKTVSGLVSRTQVKLTVSIPPEKRGDRKKEPPGSVLGPEGWESVARAVEDARRKL